jgi:hypothetical protein
LDVLASGLPRFTSGFASLRTRFAGISRFGASVAGILSPFTTGLAWCFAGRGRGWLCWHRSWRVRRSTLRQDLAVGDRRNEGGS